MVIILLRLFVLSCCCAVPLVWLTAGDAPRTGPDTGKRFPPLKLPPGFTATLFACDPMIEYPSAIALGPKPGTLFVAIDYMTGLGTEIVRRDEIRLLEDTDDDGYADKAPVFAQGFNSIQGLAHHAGTVYVMHAPFLTALRDTDGDGKADARKNLLTGLGLPPEKNAVRLHCANGVALGHDGWLYLALGDHGCDVVRPEGDRLVLRGGGILRCRSDGRDLHVFATGLRNIYDVALDDELNVFVRDNENDGGDYMIRLCHSFFGADHGYPYLYYERPAEALAPLADMGRGSSAGGVSYLEPGFSPEYRGNLFWCEWGRAVMRARPERSGSGFGPLKEIEFAAGAANDPYGFKPTDVVVGYDGALFVADWADGQRPKRGRGRIYRIVSAQQAQKAPPQKADTWLALLDSPSHHERVAAQHALQRPREKDVLARVRQALKEKRLGVHGRFHAVWILARLGGDDAVADLLALARSDPEARVQAQAVRAVADLTEPMLTQHRFDAGPGSPELARELAALAAGRDPRVLLEITIALGRLRWHDAPAWLGENLGRPDPALRHAAMQTLRRSANWVEVLKLVDLPDTEPIRALALQALADRYEPVVADGLIERLNQESDANRRRVYADWLTRIGKKPGPCVYWGYRPPPRPAPTVVWERSEAIARALNQVLSDPDRGVRLGTLRRMQREKVPTALPALAQWLRDDGDAVRVAAILDALREHPARDRQPVLRGVVGEPKHTSANRARALALLVSGVDAANESSLLELAETLEDGPVLAEALAHLGRRPKLRSSPVLVRKTAAAEPLVRAAAVLALADLGLPAGGDPARKLLQDADVRVRRAAAAAVGKLKVRDAAETLLKLAGDADPELCRAALESLRSLGEARAVPLAVAALERPEAQVAALRCLHELGGPDQAAAVSELARRQPAAEILLPTIRMLSDWGRTHEARRPALETLVAELQGASGVSVRWRVAGPLTPAKSAELLGSLVRAEKDVASGSWPMAFGEGADARVLLKEASPQSVWLAGSDFSVTEKVAVQFLGGSSGALRVWLDGRLIIQHSEPRAFQPDSERFNATLGRGAHRLVVETSSLKGAASFHLRFRRKSSSAVHEKLTQLALSRPGNAELGRKLVLDVAKSQCLKCHRLDAQGESIGPDLTSIGRRFSRIYLIESILEPNRAIAPSYESLLIELKDGRVLTGLRVAETGTALTLADREGKKHEMPAASIASRRAQPQSIMPEGLERQLTADEFVDLIAFLTSRK